MASSTPFNDKLNASRSEKLKERQGFGGPEIILPAYVYEDLIREIPTGKVVTTEVMKLYLASKYRVMSINPLITANALVLIARAAEERKGFDVPWWRILKVKDGSGMLNDKFPGGMDEQKRRLEAEGHKIAGVPGGYWVDRYQAAEYHFNKHS
jgi:alkylated DNA nucleotide flippase Atl1